MTHNWDLPNAGLDYIPLNKHIPWHNFGVDRIKINKYILLQNLSSVIWWNLFCMFSYKSIILKNINIKKIL